MEYSNSLKNNYRPGENFARLYNSFITFRRNYYNMLFFEDGNMSSKDDGNDFEKFI